MSRGIVYCLDGENENSVGDGVIDFFLKETLISAESAKRKNSSLPITIFSNKYKDELIKSGLFEKVLDCPEEKNNRPFINKIATCVNSPYDETLFLDGDTLVLVNLQNIYAKGYENYGDTGNLFDILQNFDMAFCVESLGSAKATVHPSVPNTFPVINSGVLLWKKNDKTISFFNDWFNSYRDSTNFDRSKNDQWQFRLSLWNSDVRYCTLDHPYNQRFMAERGACGNGSTVMKEPYWSHCPNDPDMFWDYVKKMNYSDPFKIVHDRLLMHNLDKWYDGRYYERRI